MYDYQGLQDVIFIMLYGMAGFFAMLACVYLLLRRGNAFAEDVRSSCVLRRWTAPQRAVPEPVEGSLSLRSLSLSKGRRAPELAVPERSLSLRSLSLSKGRRVEGPKGPTRRHQLHGLMNKKRRLPLRRPFFVVYKEKHIIFHVILPV